MLFFFVCLVFHPAVPCCTRFGWQEHLDLWTFALLVMWRTHLNFKSCNGSTLKWTCRSGNIKKMLFMNLWNILKGAQHSCKRAQHKCVEQLASPPAFSWTDVCHSVKNEPCCPSATCFSLHCGSALNQSTDTVHFHRFLLRPICTLCILYLKPAGNVYISI